MGDSIGKMIWSSEICKKVVIIEVQKEFVQMEILCQGAMSKRMRC